MYTGVYFDLDDTLVFDNPQNDGKSEILPSGLQNYQQIKKLHPHLPVYLYTNRPRSQISYPKVYQFDAIYGKEDMGEFIRQNFPQVNRFCLINPLTLFKFLYSYRLFATGQTNKALFLFLKHYQNKHKILVFDDDLRLTTQFSTPIRPPLA